MNEIIAFAPDLDPSDASLASATEMARRQLKAEDLVSQKEQELEAAKKDLAVIRDELLPAAMSVIGQEAFTLTGGFKVSVGEKYVCGQLDDLPPSGPDDKKRPLPDRLTALKLLDDLEHGDLARRVVSVTLGAKSEEIASELVELLRSHRLGNQLRIDQRRVVPWNTLAAFAKERALAGDNTVDLTVLGVSVVRRARIARPKAKAEF